MEDIISEIELEGLYIEYKKSNINNTFINEHYHDMYEIDIFEKANFDIFVKDKKYKINDRDVLLINQYDLHRLIYSTTPIYARYVIYLKKDFLDPILRSFSIPEIMDIFFSHNIQKININIKQQNILSDLLNSILKKGNNHILSPMDKAEIKAKMILLITKLCKLFSQNINDSANAYNKKDIQVESIIEYIDANYSKNISLNKLSNILHVNKYYISHIFKETTGFTVIEYLQYKRIIEAQKMLKHPDISIIDICYDCGFNSVQHFYRVFNKFTNTTPLKYKKIANCKTLNPAKS